MASHFFRCGLITVVVGILFVMVGQPATVLSQTDIGSANKDGVQVVSTLLPTGTQQIVVVDPAEKSMAVYHIDPLHGKIQLKSVRRLTLDLRMEQFNTQTPLPSELREVQPN